MKLFGYEITVEKSEKSHYGTGTPNAICSDCGKAHHVNNAHINENGHLIRFTCKMCYDAHFENGVRVSGDVASIRRFPVS